LKILSTDSACSVLDDNFSPTSILTMACVMVEYPFRSASMVKVKTIDCSIIDPTLLVHELEYCREMMDEAKPDVIHLDSTLGGVKVLELTEEMLEQMPLSRDGREVLTLILPDLHKVASDIEEKYRVPVVAIGEGSVAVRIAEMHAMAYGVMEAFQKAQKSAKPILLGVPPRLTFEIADGKVVVKSLEPLEQDLSVGVEAKGEVLSGLTYEFFHNPLARQFLGLKIQRGA